ncbi:MAG: hypothetical protein K0R62_5465 [Nonomuraea muscovyensis]|jgi:thioredoxin 1|nr:hypothetical protein [Nonomuraea muscovyensis]
MPAHAPGSVDSTTEQTFAERVNQARRPVLIQFRATRCRPRPMVTPIGESPAADRSGSWPGAAPQHVLDHKHTTILRDGGVDR